MQTHAARGDSRMLARAMGIAMATVVAATTVVLLPRAVLVLFSMVAVRAAVVGAARLQEKK